MKRFIVPALIALALPAGPVRSEPWPGWQAMCDQLPCWKCVRNQMCDQLPCWKCKCGQVYDALPCWKCACNQVHDSLPCWKCIRKGICCPDIYSRKQSPESPCPPACCEPNNYCRKPPPPQPCPAPCGCRDDYCRKPPPPCPKVGSGPWYTCGPPAGCCPPAHPRAKGSVSCCDWLWSAFRP